MDPTDETPGAESVGDDSDRGGAGPVPGADGAGADVKAGAEVKAGEAGADVEAGADGAGGEAQARDPLRFNSWMKRSATGAVMTGIAVGLQQALELPRQEPAFVIEASGEPDDPNRPIDLHFDPDNPADTVAIIRRPPPPDAAAESDQPT